MKPTRCFEYRNDTLFCEDLSLQEISTRFATPCYVYSRKSLLENLEKLQQAFPDEYCRICYAVKANSNLAILELLASRGTGFDIVSAGELYRLRRLGVSGSRIIFSGVGKRIDEIDWAIQTRVFSLGVESIEELEMIAGRVNALKSGIAVSLRLNLDVEAETHPGISTGAKKHKFGLDTELLPQALSVLRENPLVRLKGIGAHIGSQIMEPHPFILAFDRLRESADELGKSGFEIEFLDIGGGFGIPYQPEASPFRISELASYIAENRDGRQILMEPGRFIVGPSGALVSQVTLTKSTGGKKFMVIDAGMNDLMRPALYQAEHQILPVEGPNRPASIVDVVGPICESTDRFSESTQLPAMEDGELVAIMDAGAYGSVLASNYNSRGRAAEVMVDADRHYLVRERESFEDLVRGESLLP